MNDKRICTLFVAVVAFSMLALAGMGTGWTQAGPAQPQEIDNAVVNEPLHFDVSPPLREMIQRATPPTGLRVVRPILPTRPVPPAAQQKAGGGTAPGAPAGPAISATIGMTFAGVSDSACSLVNGGLLFVPPDTNMAVGDTQVVQWVNVCYAVFSKATGALIAGPFPGNAFWAGFAGDSCAVSNSGDPIIQWDKANHRWVAQQNVFSAPYSSCFAVSTTADATGTFNRYSFPQPGFPDYQKLGLTPSVYYQTQNDFGPTGSAFVGVNVCAYDGTAMRAGLAAKQVCILTGTADNSMLPADSDSAPGANLDTTEVLLGTVNNANPNSSVAEYVFKVSFKGKGKGSLSGVGRSMPIAVPAFRLACGGFANCVPQPGVADVLEVLGDRLTYRLARFVDSAGTLHFVVTHSINDTAAVAVRWYEFTAPSGSTTLTLAQSGQTANDGEFRWMGSAAMDTFGDIAIGYSRSSGTAGDFPSIYLSGHTAGEPAGMTDTESLVFAGLGSQTDSSSRWGDYSSMALDGANGCSFWYTNQYEAATGSFNFSTRIAGPIKFPSCP